MDVPEQVRKAVHRFLEAQRREREAKREREEAQQVLIAFLTGLGVSSAVVEEHNVTLVVPTRGEFDAEGLYRALRERGFLKGEVRKAFRLEVNREVLWSLLDRLVIPRSLVSRFYSEAAQKPYIRVSRGEPKWETGTSSESSTTTASTRSR